MPLLSDRTTPDGLRVIHANGELDRAELAHLRTTVQAAFADGAPSVILDMTDVTFIDSSVLAALIAESLDADQRGALLVVVTGAGGIMRSLELKGLVQVMHIAETIEQATAQLAPRP